MPFNNFVCNTLKTISTLVFFLSPLIYRHAEFTRKKSMYWFPVRRSMYHDEQSLCNPTKTCLLISDINRLPKRNIARPSELLIDCYNQNGRNESIIFLQKCHFVWEEPGVFQKMYYLSHSYWPLSHSGLMSV